MADFLRFSLTFQSMLPTTLGNQKSMMRIEFITTLSIMGMVTSLVPSKASSFPNETVVPHVIGNLPDGTPPPPAPPRRGFTVAAKDVFESKTIRQGGRNVTIRQIAPIPLPEMPPPAPPDPAASKSFVKPLHPAPAMEFLFVGATVFHSKDVAPRSLVSLWPQGHGGAVTFWSSADVALLSGFATYVGKDGIARSLLMAWGNADIDKLTQFALTHGSETQAPDIPEFSAGNAAFEIISGNPDPETLASIQSLHDLYNTEYDRLLTAFQGRERARLAREAWLKAHPPQPKDIVINFWRTETPAPRKGAAR